TPATIGHRDLAASEIIFNLPAPLGEADLPEDLRALAQPARRDGRIELHSAAPLADLGRVGSWADGLGRGASSKSTARPWRTSTCDSPPKRPGSRPRRHAEMDLVLHVTRFQLRAFL